MTSKFRPWLLPFPLLLASTFLSLFAQTPSKPAEQDQAIKVTTELIEVRAVVTDRRGQPVAGLKKEDFELLENNRPQEVSFFAEARVGPGAGGAAGAPAPGREAAPGAAPSALLAAAPARTIVIFVDTLHLSVSSALTLKQALRRFIDERLTPQDLVALVTPTGSLGVGEQFTRDRRILRYAVERIGPAPAARDSFLSPYLAAMVERGDPQALQVAMSVVAAEENLTGDRQFLENYTRSRARQVLTEAGYQSRATLLTLRAVADRLAGMPGQRLIALFSDGFTLLDNSGTPETGDLQAVVSRAARAGVVIYSIDAKGLNPPPLFDASRGNFGSDPRLSGYISASERDLENGLNALAKDTGGEPFFNTNDLGGALLKAVDENRHYYVLAYYPAGEGDAKRFRRLTVRVRNHPEYQVRAQKGYLPAAAEKREKEAAAVTPQQRLARAMLAPLPATAIGVVATADYLETEADAAQVTLQVHIDGAGVQYREQNGRQQFSLELVILIFDSGGKRVDGKSETIEGNLTPARAEMGRRNGYTMTKRLPLKPGLYQVRVGVREPGSERMGTAAAWVEVPNLERSKLALSSLLLGESAAPQAPPAGDADQLVEGSKTVQGIKFYRRGTDFLYFCKIYLPPDKPQEASGLLLQTEIYRDGKAVSAGEWLPIASRRLGQDRKGPVVGGQIKLGPLAPGIYELRLSVKRADAKKAVQRTATFGVDP